MCGSSSYPVQSSCLVLISGRKDPAPLLKQQPAPLVSSLLPAGTSVLSAASCWLLLLLLGPPADWEESIPVGRWRSGTLKGAALFLLKIYYLSSTYFSLSPINKIW